MSRPTHDEWLDEVRNANAGSLDRIASALDRIATALETLAAPPEPTTMLEP